MKSLIVAVVFGLLVSCHPIPSYAHLVDRNEQWCDTGTTLPIQYNKPYYDPYRRQQEQQERQRQQQEQQQQWQWQQEQRREQQRQRQRDNQNDFYRMRDQFLKDHPNWQ